MSVEAAETLSQSLEQFCEVNPDAFIHIVAGSPTGSAQDEAERKKRIGIFRVSQDEQDDSSMMGKRGIYHKRPY